VRQRIAKSLAAERTRRGQAVADASDHIFAFDVKTGELKWNYHGKHICARVHRHW